LSNLIQKYYIKKEILIILVLSATNINSLHVFEGGDAYACSMKSLNILILRDL